MAAASLFCSIPASPSCQLLATVRLRYVTHKQISPAQSKSQTPWHLIWGLSSFDFVLTSSLTFWPLSYMGRLWPTKQLKRTWTCICYFTFWCFQTFVHAVCSFQKALPPCLLGKLTLQYLFQMSPLLWPVLRKLIASSSKLSLYPKSTALFSLNYSSVFILDVTFSEKAFLTTLYPQRIPRPWISVLNYFSYDFLGEGNGNPLQYSCLENPMDRGAWWAAVHWVTQSRTGLKWLSSSSSMTSCCLQI